VRNKILTALAALMLWGGFMAAPALAGSGSSSHNGLTCNTSWHNTWGGTSCHGSPHPKSRLHVACAFQSDYSGSWHYGPGSDGFECNFSVQSASVQWG